MTRPDGRPRRTQVQRRAAAEERVLDAATALVAEGGLRALTLAAVGQRAGFSRGIVTHHFGSRDALLTRLVVALQDRFTPPESADLTGREALLALAAAYLVHACAEPVTAKAFLVLWAESMTAQPELRAVFAQRDDRFRHAVATTVRAGVEDGSIRADADAHALGYLVVGLLRGIVAQTLVAEHLVDHDRLVAEVRDLLWKGTAPG